MPDEQQQTDKPEPQQTDSEQRVSDFMKRYGELVQELQIDFATYPVWVPDQTGGFRTVMQSTPVDIKNQPRKSPFVAQ